MWLDDEDEKKKPEEAPKAGLVEEKLFKSRTVLITGQVEHKMAKAVTAQLLALAADGDDWINVFVSSPGGHVESGDMIYDMLKFVGPKVRVIGTGWVASAGLSALAIATAVAVFCGWRAALRKQIAAHRRWMWRTFLLLCSAVVIRMMGGLATVAQFHAAWWYPLATWTSWLAPLLVFELARRIHSTGHADVALH